MNTILIIILIVILIIIFATNRYSEQFNYVDSNIYENISNSPIKLRFLSPPYSSQPNIDYQNYLDTVSGYDSASRSYNNPFYAQNVAAGLDTN